MVLNQQPRDANVTMPKHGQLDVVTGFESETSVAAGASFTSLEDMDQGMR